LASATWLEPKKRLAAAQQRSDVTRTKRVSWRAGSSFPLWLLAVAQLAAWPASWLRLALGCGAEKATGRQLTEVAGNCSAEQQAMQRADNAQKEPATTQLRCAQLCQSVSACEEVRSWLLEATLPALGNVAGCCATTNKLQFQATQLRAIAARCCKEICLSATHFSRLG